MSDSTPKRFEVEITRDIEYGRAGVAYGDGTGPANERALCLDYYRPIDAPGLRPALVLAFGGAFHRGTKENDVRPEDGPKNTSTASYCERFAARGFACFSIDYRLTQEDPHPGYTPALGVEPISTSRIDVVRKILGLEPATPLMISNTQEAAIDDMVSAYRYVCGEAPAYQIDPARIAVGGFSAGARTSTMAAMAERISPAAVVALSGLATQSVVDRFHATARRRMPIFLGYGEDDLDYVVAGVPRMIEQLKAAGHTYQSCLLPGQTHFYPAQASVQSSVGNPATLEEAIEQFLARHLS